jgi:alpha-1,6-mannosyltransferase
VLYFNTVLNKSHEWGTSPFHWYFTSAIPKSITLAIPLTLIGLVYRRKQHFLDLDILTIIIPAFLFVGLYSLLPHKELRFIFPALTLFNLGGAMGLSKM